MKLRIATLILLILVPIGATAEDRCARLMEGRS